MQYDYIDSLKLGFKVTFKIVGNAYPDVIFDLLGNVIQKGLLDINDKLELLEARILDMHDVEFITKDKYRKELVTIRRRLIDTEMRIEDMNIIDEVRGKEFREEFIVIDEFRQKLFDRCRRF